MGSAITEPLTSIIQPLLSFLCVLATFKNPKEGQHTVPQFGTSFAFGPTCNALTH